MEQKTKEEVILAIQETVLKATQKSLLKIKPDYSDLISIVQNKEFVEQTVEQAVEKATTSAFEKLSISKKYKPKSIREQVNVLRSFFPSIGDANETIAKEGNLPIEATGWFAIPKWQSIASSYAEATLRVLNLVKAYLQNGFYSYQSLDSSNFNQSLFQETLEKKNSIAKIAKFQNGYDTLVLPIQMGILHKGKTARGVRDSFGSNEFGLGVFEFCIIILTHLENFQRPHNLHFCCTGDNFRHAKSSDKNVLCFGYQCSSLEFYAQTLWRCEKNIGHPSAFVVE